MPDFVVGIITFVLIIVAFVINDIIVIKLTEIKRDEFSKYVCDRFRDVEDWVAREFDKIKKPAPKKPTTRKTTTTKKTTKTSK